MSSEDKPGDETPRLPQAVVFIAWALLGLLATPSVLMVLCARDGRAISFGFLSLAIPLLLVLIWSRRSLRIRVTVAPKPPDTWGRVWMRCWIILCTILVFVQVRASNLPKRWGGITDHRLLLFGSLCGLILFLSSLIVMRWHCKLAWFGLIVSIPAMALILTPAISR